MAERRAALAGIRVIDLSHQAAGPWCTSLLGDLGADVVKVEKPGRGDGIRYADRTGRLPPEIGGLNFQGLNRNKRGLTIDIGQEAGAALVRRLVAPSDVLVENFRPGVMERHGLGYETLRGLNPRLVYCSITAFGPRGPLAQHPGMDLIPQAPGGLMGHTGAQGRPPRPAPRRHRPHPERPPPHARVRALDRAPRSTGHPRLPREHAGRHPRAPADRGQCRGGRAPGRPPRPHPHPRPAGQALGDADRCGAACARPRRAHRPGAARVRAHRCRAGRTARREGDLTMATPAATLLHLMTGYRAMQALYVAARLGIADLLKDGARGSEELARATGADARALHRLLRALASLGVFG